MVIAEMKWYSNSKGERRFVIQTHSNLGKKYITYTKTGLTNEPVKTCEEKTFLRWKNN